MWNEEGWRRSVGPIMWKEAGLQRVREERNILHAVKRRKANWIGHILCRSCLLKRCGRKDRTIEVMARRGWRHKQLLDHLKEMRRYWKLKEEALDVTLWELALEEAMELLLDKIHIYIYIIFFFLFIYSLTSYVVWRGSLSLTALLSGWHHQSVCSSRSYRVVCCMASKPLIRNSLCTLTIWTTGDEFDVFHTIYAVVYCVRALL